MLDFIVHKNKFVPGWLPENDLALMLTTMQAARSKTYVEIGTLLGKSASAISQLPFVEKVITMDTFNATYFKDATIAEDYPRTDDAFEEMARNTIIEHGESEKVTILRGRSDQLKETVFEVLAGAKIDFLFIDGDHSYQQVYKDYMTYVPLMATNGIIAVHDVARNAHAGAAKAFAVMHGADHHRFFLKSPKLGSIGFIYMDKDAQ